MKSVLITFCCDDEFEDVCEMSTNSRLNCGSMIEIIEPIRTYDTNYFTLSYSPTLNQVILDYDFER